MEVLCLPFYMVEIIEDITSNITLFLSGEFFGKTTQFWLMYRDTMKI